jgi:hypothetical protein
MDNCKMVNKRCNTGRAKIYPWDVFKLGPVRSGNTTGSTKKQAGENGKATHNWGRGWVWNNRTADWQGGLDSRVVGSTIHTHTRNLSHIEKIGFAVNFDKYKFKL